MPEGQPSLRSIYQGITTATNLQLDSDDFGRMGFSFMVPDKAAAHAVVGAIIAAIVDSHVKSMEGATGYIVYGSVPVDRVDQ